jgi:hypothetical protein
VEQPPAVHNERFILGAFILSNAFLYISGIRKTNEKLLSEKVQIELPESAEFCDYRWLPNAMRSPGVCCPRKY